VEVVQAQDALARANDNQIEALFEYNQSRANLAHAEGHMNRCTQSEVIYAPSLESETAVIVSRRHEPLKRLPSRILLRQRSEETRPANRSGLTDDA